MIKLAIADDHQMFTDGLVSLLEQECDIQIIGIASNGEEVIRILENNFVDVAILDIEMPRLGGIETTKIIKSRFPKTKVLIVSMFRKKEFIVNLMHIGVSGYVLKTKSKQQLIHAIHQIHAGNVHFGIEILNELSNGRIEEKTQEPELTDREKDVLREIGNGNSTKEISLKLRIEETTVNTHKRNLRHKLDAPNEKHLVRYAIKHGYSHV